MSNSKGEKLLLIILGVCFFLCLTEVWSLRKSGSRCVDDKEARRVEVLQVKAQLRVAHRMCNVLQIPAFQILNLGRFKSQRLVFAAVTLPPSLRHQSSEIRHDIASRQRRGRSRRTTIWQGKRHRRFFRSSLVCDESIRSLFSLGKFGVIVSGI